MSDLELMPLTAELVDLIRPWFDDPDTKRYLGGSDWPDQALRLAELVASGTSTERHVVARHSWVAFEGNDAVGLLGVEAYTDRTASLSVLVRPDRRQQGYGIHLLSAARRWAASTGAVRIVAGAEPDNVASVALLQTSGFSLNDVSPDQQGFLNFSLEV